MSETTAPNDNLLVSYAISNNGSAFSEPVAFSTINSKSIVSGGITTIKLVVTVQDDSSSITEPLDLAFQVKLEKGAEVWGGTVASSFARGNGEEGSPYEIETAEQLAYLAYVTNSGTLESGKYFKQTQPIVLNNYALIFDSASGLVLVNNNTETLCCLGTGLNGTVYNTGTAGVAGVVYTAAASTGSLVVGMIPSDLYAWTPIGNSTNKFQGTFDGNGYEISGLYINTNLDNQGLFGYAVNSTIENVGVVDSFIYCDSYAGNILGYGEGTTIDNCYNFGIVSGDDEIGGVVGYNTGGTTNCYNTGTISGNEYVGGIVGYNQSEGGPIADCYNTGAITGYRYVAGIVGENNDSIITNCYNTGTIIGNGYIGGIVGENFDTTIMNCYNTGSIDIVDRGNNNVGGIAGYNYSCKVTDCYNTGNITGDSNDTGGIVGYSDKIIIMNCYNTGTIIGNGHIGGIAGDTVDSALMNCYNTSTITGGVGESYVAGLVGYNYRSSVVKCYNNGSITGGSEVGGIIGRNDNSNLANCYNTGNVTGSSADAYIGGVVGYSYSISTIMNCYNTGTVISVKVSNYVGGIAGENGGDSIVTSSYYLVGSYTNGIGVGSGNEISSFDTDQILSSEIIIGGITYTANTTSLLNILNAWVMENLSEMIYQSWQVVFGVNEGYPIFDIVPMDETIATAFAVGTGTELDPYLISNEKELIYLAYITNSGTLETSDKYFKLTNDIILNTNSYLYETWDVSAPSNSWTAIGNQYYNFMGNFNGNNHTISGLYINKSLDYQGLFGYISGATLQNVSIINSYVKGTDYIGGIDGFNRDSIITNCYNTGIITGNYYVAGIVGYNSYGNLTNCYNTGTITGGSEVGGIVGNDNGVTINCYNTGTITGRLVGGIVGNNNGVTINCYNTGIITGDHYVGGIVGYNSHDSIITNCYNIGNISGTAQYVGGIVGKNDWGCNITNCYNIGNISGTAQYVGGIVGMNNWGNISNCYYLSTTATNAIGKNDGIDSYTNIGSVTGPSAYIVYITNSDGTKNSSTTSLLKITLNDWVNANSETYSITLKTWTLTGSTNGYPKFA